MEKNDVKIEKPLEQVLHESMLPYAEYVILDRALPRVEDGLKPVQRRILFTMLELGLEPDKPFRKCARIVGDCLGKYHPHGDTSVYDALVRLAQDFNMRECLVSGHGNFGSIDGDSAAAMRYTEAKLTPLAMELLRDLEKDTVKYNLNFDDSLKEPDVLPGRYPNLLVNGSSGIAVGLATNIPPHNLSEVIDGVITFMNNPKITLAQMMKIIKGPDFPTGGFLIVGEELLHAYETGRGKVTMRAKCSIENENNDKKNIIISELPYQVNKSNLLTKILSVKEDKKEIFSGISDICDESDRNGMRAVIKLKKDADAKAILNSLFKYTDMSCTFGINMVAIADGKPQQMGLLEIIRYYVDYQLVIIQKRTKFDLNQAKDREHILEGLVIAVQNIDEVIRIIKSSASVSEARANLRERFKISERQAQAILDMRLARLTNLEIYKLETELEELKILIDKLSKILASKKLQIEVIETELKEIKKKFKTDRKTEIFKDFDDKKMDTFYEEEVKTANFVLAITNENTIKKSSEKNYRMTNKLINDKSSLYDLNKQVIKCDSTQNLFFITNKGNCLKISVSEIEEIKFNSRGKDFKDLSKELIPGEIPVYVFAASGDTLDGCLLLFTKDGMIKKTEYKEYILLKNYYQVMKLKDNDEITHAEKDLDETTIIFITKDGLCLNALKDEIPVQGRVAGGVKGINLSENDEIIFISQTDNEGEIVVITSLSTFKRVITGTIEPIARYRKGVKIAELGDKGKVIFASIVQEPYDLIFVTNDIMQSMTTENISIENRTAKGKTLTIDKKKVCPDNVYINNLIEL